VIPIFNGFIVSWKNHQNTTIPALWYGVAPEEQDVYTSRRPLLNIDHGKTASYNFLYSAGIFIPQKQERTAFRSHLALGQKRGADFETNAKPIFGNHAATSSLPDCHFRASSNLRTRSVAISRCG
jgi:hypothetical protein